MKKLQLLILFVALLFVAKAQNSSIFVEAESFTIKDGWVVDPQFIEQMGSPYLLAHGLGKSVQDAETRILYE
ncbi:MAG TPA: hypothetical protein VIK10_02300 [Prolixibacteraceae bacterium]